MIRPETDYVPVDCSFYDRIEDAVVCHQPVALGLDGGRTLTARVLDVGARDGADWADVEGVGLVRLDAILELGGVPRPGSSACGLPER